MAELPRVGEVFAGYRILSVLGHGGMATVFEAEDPNLERHVALKVVRPELLAYDEGFRIRFQQEARIAASLEHPHIVPIYQHGEQEDGTLFLVQRLMKGPSLGGLLIGGPLRFEKVASVLTQLAQALDFAHRRGLVHRDVKPANVLLQDGSLAHVYLADFGLARPVAQLGLTRTGVSIGTPRYMAPEQVLQQSVTAQTDVYALGCLAYECLTGHPVFHEMTNEEALRNAQLNQMPNPPSMDRSDLPLAVDQVLTIAMAKSPSARFATAGRFAEVLRFALGENTTIEPSPVAGHGQPSYQPQPSDPALHPSGPGEQPPSPSQPSASQPPGPGGPPPPGGGSGPPSRQPASRRGLAKVLVPVAAVLALVLAFVLGGQLLSSDKPSQAVAPTTSRSPTTSSSAVPTTTAATSTTEPTELTTAEKALATHAPERGCTPWTYKVNNVDGLRAAIRCPAKGGADGVEYYKFQSRDAMEAYYQEETNYYGVHSEGECGVSRRAEGPYDVQGHNVGHLLCISEDNDGDAIIEWTDNRLSIAVWAYRKGGGIAALKALNKWWVNNAGPTL
jgi:serine/threonine protein kinase